MIIFFLFLALKSILAKPVQAQVVISEVMPAPDEGSEWIELHNQSPTQDYQLKDWLLEDQLVKASTIHTFDKFSLKAQDFVSVELTQNKLNNGADGVTLVNAEKQIVDSFSYEFSQAGQSWSRQSDGSFTLTEPTKNQANLTVVEPTTNPNPTTSPSPSPLPSPNPSPSPSFSPEPSPSPETSPEPETEAEPSPTAEQNFDLLIEIADFEACPTKDQNEWVKLYNSGHHTYDLSGWRLRDAANQTRKINFEIKARDYATLSWGNHLLNNSGDTIQLENADGQIIDSLSYQNCDQILTDSEMKTDSNSDVDDSNQDSEQEAHQDSADSSTNSTPSQLLPNESSSIETKNSTETPPIKPTLSYDYNQVILGSRSASISGQAQPSLTTFFTKSYPPLWTFSSVILGGCLLLAHHGWSLLKNIFPHFFGQV